MKAAGKTLIIIGMLINSVVYSASGQWVQTNGPYGGSFETITINDSVLYTNVFGRGVFRTSDKGKTWTAMNDGLIEKDIYSLVSLNNELFAGTEFNGMHIHSGSNNRWSKFEFRSGNSYDRILNMVVQGSEIWAATDEGLLKLNKTNGNWVDSLIHPMQLSQTIAVTDSFIFVTSRDLLERSADHGVTWVACTTGLPESPISCLKMLDDTLGLIGTEKGVYITGNGGGSWSIITGGMETQDNVDIRGFAARNDTILFSSCDRVWLSVDRGITWTDFNTDFMFKFPGQIGLIGNSVFLATSAGIFTSSFSERKWTDISAGIVSGNVAAMLKVWGTTFAGCDANGQLYRSDDSGMNWAVSDSGFDLHSKVYALTLFDSVLYAGSNDQWLLQSNDFGRSWTICEFRINIVRSFIEIGGNLLVGHAKKGICLLADSGTTLLESNTGVPEDTNECGCSGEFHFHPSVLSFTALDNTVFAALAFRGVYSSADSGATWQAINSGLDTNVTALFAASGILLAGTQDKGIFRSKDKGASWSSCETDLSNIPVVAFAGYGATTFAGTGNGVFFSNNSGVTWNKGETSFNDSIQSLLVDGDYLLAGTATRGVWRRPLSGFKAGVRNPQLENGAKSTFVSMEKRGFTFSCRFNTAHTEQLTIKLYNLQGKMIALLKNSRVGPGGHVFESDLRKYKSGCYIIRFEAGTVRRSMPIMISRP